MRRRIPILAIPAIAAIALAGCSAQMPAAQEPEPAPAGSESATPTPTPTPTELVLSTEEAGTLYLDLVCDVNSTTAQLDDAFSSTEQDFLNGGNPDPAGVKDAAARRIEANRMALEVLDDDYYVWPASIRESMGHIRDYYLSELSTLNTIANAGSYSDAYYAPFNISPEQQSAGQNVRYELGLSTDTVASCKGHEGKLADLHEQTKARATASEG